MQEPKVEAKGKLALISYLFFVTATFGFLQPFVPLYFKTGHPENLVIGLMIGCSTAAALFLQPVWGRLSDRFDTRRPFIFGLGVSAALAYLSFPHVKGVWAFMVLNAVGQNAVIYLNAVGGVLVGRMVAKQKGGATYANYRLWGSIGYIVVTLAVGFTLGESAKNLDLVSLNRAFSTAPFIFVFAALLAFWVPDFHKEKSKRNKMGPPPLPKNLKWFLACYFLYQFTLYGASTYLSLFMRTLTNNYAWVTAMFAGGVVCEVLVLRVSGRFSDEYGRRPLLVFTYLLLPVRLALYALCQSPYQVFLVQLLHGFNFGIMGAVAVALINDLCSDENRGQAQARLAVASGLAASTSPIVLGWLCDRLGYRGMFLGVAGLAAVAAAILVLKLEETHPSARLLADRVPQRLKGLMKVLDGPVRRKG